MDGIYITRAELEALEDAEGVLVKGYLWLRSRMDLRTGIVGRVTGISHAAVAEHCEYVVRKGQGWQRFRLGDTPQAIKEGGRRVLERLENIGLIVKQGGPLLCFLCPLARLASVRPDQTGHVRATPLPTERGTPANRSRASNGAGFEALRDDTMLERDTHEYEQYAGNGPHIRDQGVYTPQSSSTTGSEVAPDDAGAAGVNRDRAAPSQAGSACCRSGKTDADPYRDRPAGSHVGPQARPDSDATSSRDRASPSHPALSHRLAPGADAGGALHDVSQPADARGSAANDSLADGIASPEATEPLLRAVLAARGVRLGVVEPIVTSWVEAGVSPGEVSDAIDRARDARIKADSTQPIPLAYIHKVVESQRAAARRAAARLDGEAPRAWRGGRSDLSALARQLGIADARPGESAAAFRERVMQAREARNHG